MSKLKRYLTMLMPGVHSITPFLDFSLDRRKLFLQKLPHEIHITAIQPVMIDGNGILLLIKDALLKLSKQVGQAQDLDTTVFQKNVKDRYALTVKPYFVYTYPRNGSKEIHI